MKNNKDSKSTQPALKSRLGILIGLVVFIVIASILGIYLMSHKSSSDEICAEIYRDDVLLRTIDLSDVDEPYQIKLEYGDNDYNIVEVRQGSIGIVEASCPDHLCQNMGFIDSSVMPITCLPNHLIIKVVTGQSDTENIDSVAY